MARKANKTSSLRLTQHQRNALLEATGLRPKIKQRLLACGEGTQSVEFSDSELRHLDEQVDDSVMYANSITKKRLVAIQKKLVKVLADAAPPRRKKLPINSDLLFQFRITLNEIQPVIWRRIQVEDCTLGDLHEGIQAAFGWWNYHLHQFVIEGTRFGPPDAEEYDNFLETEDESKVLLSQLLPESGQRTRWTYEYDFGDDWRHEVLFEGYPPKDAKAKYPLCLEGERACPPEDIGGPWGFATYLEALTDPGHERHEEFLQWRGPFDPLAFDPHKATQEMRKVM